MCYNLYCPIFSIVVVIKISCKQNSFFFFWIFAILLKVILGKFKKICIPIRNELILFRVEYINLKYFG